VVSVAELLVSAGQHTGGKTVDIEIILNCKTHCVKNFTGLTENINMATEETLLILLRKGETSNVRAWLCLLCKH
jgi:hypothetical protein